MKKENKEILIKRLKSLGWRAGMFLFLMALNFAAENAGLLGLPTIAVALISYIASEVTKQVNS